MHTTVTLQWHFDHNCMLHNIELFRILPIFLDPIIKSFEMIFPISIGILIHRIFKQDDCYVCWCESLLFQSVPSFLLHMIIQLHGIILMACPILSSTSHHEIFWDTFFSKGSEYYLYTKSLSWVFVMFHAVRSLLCMRGSSFLLSIVASANSKRVRSLNCVMIWLSKLIWLIVIFADLLLSHPFNHPFFQRTKSLVPRLDHVIFSY